MSGALEERLTQVESAVMLIQRDVETLSESMIDYSRLLEELKKSLEKLTSSVESLEGEEQRDPRDERPPHY